MKSLIFTSISLANTALAASVIQTCAWKDGSLAEDYYPCTNSTATSGNCCLKGEACTTNGMCYGGVGLVYRGACINSWGGDCLTYCDDLADKWANFYPCAYADSGSTLGPQTWWCGATGTEMCTQVNGSHLVNINPGGPVKLAGVTASTVTVSVSGTVTSTSTPTSSSGSSAPNTPDSNSSATTDTCAVPDSSKMIGMGVTIGVLAIAGVAAGLWGHRKYRQQQKRLDVLLAGHRDESTGTGVDTNYQQEQMYQPGHVYTSEMSHEASLLKVEMDGRDHLNAVEIGDNGPKR